MINQQDAGAARSSRRTLSGRRSLMLSAGVLALVCAQPALAQNLPTGGSLAGGAASGFDAPVGNALNIAQTSDRAVIDWTSFNIANGYAVNFAQPSSTAIAVNRVSAGGGLSEIHGQLNANGVVAILNPNGVHFGGTAQVNVGGLIATTGDLANQAAFLAGGPLAFAGATGGAVTVGSGASITSAGLAAFVAPHVSNSGVINATAGRVVLAAGDTFTLDLAGDGLLALGVSSDTPLVENHGDIFARGGVIRLSAAAASDVVGQIINDGGLHVRSVGVGSDGVVVLEGGNTTVQLAGDYDAAFRISGGLGLDGGLTVDGGGEAVIQVGAGQTGLTINASDVTVQGLTFNGPITAPYTEVNWDSAGNSWGVQVTGANLDNVNLLDNEFLNLRTGVLFAHSGNPVGQSVTGTVSGNLFENTKGGVIVQYRDGTALTLANNREGPIGNEWGVVYNTNLSPAIIAATAPEARQAFLLGVSNANNGLTVLDRGYTNANRTHVNVAAGGLAATNNALGNPREALGSIQAGVNAVVAGGVVNVADGTYALSATLNIRKSLSLIGAGEGQTIIDASGLTAYGVYVNADDVTLSNFTLNGPTTVNTHTFGIKAQAQGAASARMRNLTVTDVTIDGSNRTALDLNGVVGARIEGVTITNTANGVGIGLTDSADVTITRSVTANNGSGGLALYNRNSAFDQQLANITVDASNSFGEDVGVYLQDYATALHDVGALTIEGFDFAVHNGEYTYFQADIAAATAYALGLETPQTTSIEGWTGTDYANHFTVVNGLTIGAAVRDARAGGVINIGAGTFAETVTINNALSLLGAGQADTIINGGVRIAGHDPAGSFIDGLSISDLTINASAGQIGLIALSNFDGVYNTRNLSLTDVTVNANGQHGIGLFDVDGATFDNVTVNGDGSAFAGIEAIGLRGFTMTGGGINNTQTGLNIFDHAGYEASGSIVLSGVSFTGNRTHANLEAVAGEADLSAILAANSFDRTIHADGGHAIYGDLAHAVGDAASGSTLNLSADTFVTTEQLLIDRDLTLVGANGTVVEAGRNFAGGNPSQAWWLVGEGVTFGLSGVTLDGAGFNINYALRNHGHTSIDNVVFRDIAATGHMGFAVASFGGVVDAGAGEGVWGDSTLTVTNSTFENIGRIGVLLKGTGATADISGSTFTGKGEGTHIDYGIEVGAGAYASITGNTFTNHRGTVAPWGSAGILVTTYYGGDGAVSRADIQNNVITGNTSGVAVGYQDADVSVVNAFNNDLSGNDRGVSLSSAAVVDFTGNWWGFTAEGDVAAYMGGAQAGAVDFSTFLTSGADTSAAAGFQGDFSNLRVTSLGGHYGPAGRIQRGINLVTAGGVVNVGAGTYAETVTIRDALSLLGSGQADTIINGGVQIAGHDPAGSFIDGLSISNLTINAGAGQIALIALSNVDGAYNTRNLSLSNVTVNANGAHAIGLFDVDGATLDNVTIDADGGIGIEAIGVARFAMTGGSISNAETGVNVWEHAGYEDNGAFGFSNVAFAGNRTHVAFDGLTANADIGAILAGNSFDRTVHATGGSAIYGDLVYAVGQSGVGDTLNLSADTFTLARTLRLADVSLIGAGIGQTVIDASAVTAYGLDVSGDDVTLSGFTLNGPTAVGPHTFAIKAQARGVPAGRMNNLTVANVAIDGSYRTGLDLNGVVGALIDGVIVTNTANGNGIAITDSANVTIRNSTTSGNAWGGLALYQKNADFDQQLGNITVEASNSFGEAAGLYLQDTSSIHADVGALTIHGFNHVVWENPTSRVFQENGANAAAFALTRPSTASIEGWNVTAGTNVFTVVDGLAINNALRDVRAGGVINVGAGTYAGFATAFGGPANLSILGAAGAVIDGSGVTGRIVDLRADGATLSGFTIAGDGVGVGVSISGQGVTVSGNTISNVLTGVQTTTQHAAGGAAITGNIITAAHGVSLQNTGNTVSGNTVTASVEGVGLLQSANTFSGNTFALAAGADALNYYGAATSAGLAASGNTVGIQGGGLQGAFDLAGAGGALNVGAATYGAAASNAANLSVAFNNATVASLALTGAGARVSGQLTGVGNLSFADLTLLGALTLASQNGGVATGAVTGPFAFSATANAGAVTLGALNTASVTASGASIVTAGATTTGAQSYAGATTLNGAYATGGGAFTVSGPATLAGATGVTTNGGAVSLGTVNGARALNVAAGSGAVALGALGGSQALTSATVSGGAISTVGARTTGAQSYTGASVSLSGQYATSGGGFTVSGPATLAGATGIATNGGAVSLGTVNGARALNVAAGSGAVALGALGGSQALASATVSGGAIGTVGARTTGAQSYTGASVGLSGAYVTGGVFTVSGPATLNGAVAVTTNGGDASLGAVNGSSTGGQAFSLNVGAGSASLGALGALARLGDVIVTANQAVLTGSVYAGDSLSFRGAGAGATVRLTQALTTFTTVQSPASAGDITITPHLIGTTNGGQGVVFLAGTGASAGDGDIILTNAGTDAVRLGAMNATGGDFSAQTVKLAGDFTSILSGDQAFSDNTLDTLGDVLVNVAGNERGRIVAGGSVNITAGGSATGVLQAGGPVTVVYGAGSDRIITAGGPVTLTSTGGPVGGSITGPGPISINSAGPITTTISSPGSVTLTSSQPVAVQVDGGVIVVNAPGGVINGVFSQISTDPQGFFIINGAPVVGEGVADSRQTLIDSFILPAGGVVGASGEIRLPAALAIALIAPAGEGEGQRPAVVVNNVDRLGELLRLGYTAIIIQIDESGLEIEEELILAEAAGEPAA